MMRLRVRGAMIAVHTAAAPPPSRGARAPVTPGVEVVLGHPTPYAPDDISLGEAMSSAH
jgi:hypothetical protein